MSNFISERILQLNLLLEPTFGTLIYWTSMITLWTFYLLEVYLCYRQRQVYISQFQELPPHLQAKVDMTPEVFERARQHSLDKLELQIVAKFYQLLILLLFLHFRTRFDIFLHTLMVETPMSLYSLLVLKHKHGFNNNQLFATYSSSAKAIFRNILYTIFPIGDIFRDKRSPLKEGPLRSRLEGLAARCNFPPNKILVNEASQRTKHSNAAFLGFFCLKRIYLYDTLIKGYVTNGDEEGEEEQGLSEEEVEAVLAHEIGHWKCRHVEKGVTLALVVEIGKPLIFFGFFRTMEFFCVSFWRMPVAIIQMCLVADIILMVLFTEYLKNKLSRLFEYQADAYATKLGYGEQLKTGLLKVCKDNLHLPFSDGLYSSWYDSHPTVIERLEAIDVLMAKMK